MDNAGIHPIGIFENDLNFDLAAQRNLFVAKCQYWQLIKP